MNLRLPSRYEDLDPRFRSKLRPVPSLNALVQEAFASMKVSGGIRFLPIFGRSGSGKSCGALELATHIPSSHLEVLMPELLSKSTEDLISHLERQIYLFNGSDLFIWVIDQYEEKVQGKRDVPTEFVERLSLLDRRNLTNHRMLFLWLTTDTQFRDALAEATSRNERILLRRDFELVGIPREEWPPVIEDTFSFHNEGKELADFGILKAGIETVSQQSDTIGRAIEQIGLQLSAPRSRLEDISEYQVILVWPVVDGTGIERVSGFTNPSLGYKLNWSAWYNRLTEEDRKQLPLNEYNRARLYFDLRLVPVPAADLRAVCLKLEDDAYTPAGSYLAQLKRTHFFAVVSGAEDERSIGTLSGRE